MTKPLQNTPKQRAIKDLTQYTSLKPGEVAKVVGVHPTYVSETIKRLKASEIFTDKDVKHAKKRIVTLAKEAKGEKTRLSANKYIIDTHVGKEQKDLKTSSVNVTLNISDLKNEGVSNIIDGLILDDRTAIDADLVAVDEVINFLD